jgi:opacity protein-like surface antigen
MADADFRTTGTEHYPANFSKTRSGAIGGVGGEVGITRHLSVKAEYLYYDLRKAEATIGPAIPFPPGLPNFQVQYTWKTQANTFNAGVNYRF